MAVLNLDTSQRLDIICRKGDTFQFSFDVGDPTLAGETGDWQMHVRPTEYDENTPKLSASDAVDGSVITITISATDMGDIDSGLYVYDIQFVGVASQVKTYLHGTFKVNEDITI